MAGSTTRPDTVDPGRTEEEEEQQHHHHERLGGFAIARDHVVILVLVLLASKVAVLLGTVVLIAHGDYSVLLYLLSPAGFGSLLHAITTDWDSVQYELIAQMGYSTFKGSELYAFSPLYPATIYLFHFLTGSYWTASLVVPNALSFVFPVIVLRLFGLRAALLAETFPVYVVYSMIAYSDVIALVFLALALLCFVKRKYLLTGVSLALAGVVFYELFVVAVVFCGYLLFEQQHSWRVRRAPGEGRDALGQVARAVASVAIPVLMAGVAMLAVYWFATGDPFKFFELERTYWGVLPSTPIGQIEWLFDGKGTGSFANFEWEVYGVAISSVYWAVRNALFEAFFFIGVYLLVKTKDDPFKWLLVGYSLLISIPLLFVVGTPVYSIPRLLLPAFPIYLGYSTSVFDRNWKLALYIVASICVACWVLLTFTFAFFA